MFVDMLHFFWITFKVEFSRCTVISTRNFQTLSQVVVLFPLLTATYEVSHHKSLSTIGVVNLSSVSYRMSHYI
jgi:hypothetical protein